MSVLIEVVLSLSGLGAVIFFLVLLINHKAFGITHMFNAKRRTIISEIIELIKNKPRKWNNVDGLTKRFPPLDIQVRGDWFYNASYISNRDHEYKISFLECVRLSWHFRKLEKYLKAEKKREEIKERDAAVDNILLTTTRMDEL